MRHKVYGKHLGRNKNQRKALFKSLVQSLILSGSIQTTEAKAKAIKPTVDKIINQAKNKNTQRLLQQFLVAKPVREKLIKDIAPTLKDRTSGYTSVVKLGQRLGDGAMMVRMSLLISEKSNPSTALRTRVQSEKSVDTSDVESKVKSEQNTSEVRARKVEKPSKRAKTTKTASRKGAVKKP